MQQFVLCWLGRWMCGLGHVVLDRSSSFLSPRTDSLYFLLSSSFKKSERSLVVWVIAFLFLFRLDWVLGDPSNARRPVRSLRIISQAMLPAATRHGHLPAIDHMRQWFGGSVNCVSAEIVLYLLPIVYFTL